MQICPVNRTNFGAIGNAVYTGDFNPDKNETHAKMRDAVLNQPEVKKFAENRNCDVWFHLSDSRSPSHPLNVRGMCVSLESPQLFKTPGIVDKLTGKKYDYTKVPVLSKKELNQNKKLPALGPGLQLYSYDSWDAKDDYQEAFPERGPELDESKYQDPVLRGIIYNTGYDYPSDDELNLFDLTNKINKCTVPELEKEYRERVFDAREYHAMDPLREWDYTMENSEYKCIRQAYGILRPVVEMQCERAVDAIKAERRESS